MRARPSPFIFRSIMLLTGMTIASPIAFAACSAGPAVVTNANDALGPGPATSSSALPIASASATPAQSASAKRPLEIAGPTQIPLPPFSCAPAQQVNLLGSTFCIIPDARGWHEAEAHCQEHGAHLAVLKTSAQSNALRVALTAPVGVDRFWIGMAEPSEGRWLWSDGTPVKFFAWGNGEPNNFGGRGEDCGNWETVSGRWNDADCFMRMHFLCEGKTPPPNSRAKPMACPGKRFTVGQSDYCLQGPATWGEAQKQCVKDGGELAMLDTEAENAALFHALGARISGGNLWIGLSDEAVEGQFRWINGEPLDSPLWRSGEPNNVNEEDCTEWLPEDGLWNDVPCAIARPSICEKPTNAIAK